MKPLFSGENVDEETGRWVLGRSSAAACPYCGHPPVVKIAGNGKAEFHHTPTHCCHRTAAKSRRWDSASRREVEEYGEVDS